MKNYKLFTGILNKLINGKNALVIDRNQNIYEYFSCEYSKIYSKDYNDNIIVPIGKQESARNELQNNLLVRNNSDAYSYFMCEYRQNKPMVDSFGNFIINDCVKTKIR